MKAKLTEQQETIRVLRDQVDKMETNRRVNSLIFKSKDFGTRKVNEDIEGVTVSILNKKFPDMRIGRDDIQTVHRLQNENTVICNFFKTLLRDEVYQRRLSSDTRALFTAPVSGCVFCVSVSRRVMTSAKVVMG